MHKLTKDKILLRCFFCSSKHVLDYYYYYYYYYYYCCCCVFMPSLVFVHPFGHSKSSCFKTEAN